MALHRPRTPGGDVAASRTVRPEVTDAWVARGGQYEYRVLTLGRHTGRGDARTLLTEEAEHGRWELARTLVYAGGNRKVWLRRKVIRVRSTL
jgi:hypothetical protein